MLRIFLGFNAIVWLPYGLYCLVDPGYLNEAAGLAATNATASTEIRAMYGGLQAAIGCLAVAALLRPSIAPTAVLAIGFVATGLAVGRLAGLLADGGLSGYTTFALVFEIVLATSAAALFSRGGLRVESVA